MPTGAGEKRPLSRPVPSHPTSDSAAGLLLAAKARTRDRTPGSHARPAAGEGERSDLAAGDVLEDATHNLLVSDMAGVRSGVARAGEHGVEEQRRGASAAVRGAARGDAVATDPQARRPLHG
jgi:hypothetical protein